MSSFARVRFGRAGTLLLLATALGAPAAAQDRRDFVWDEVRVKCSGTHIERVVQWDAAQSRYALNRLVEAGDNCFVEIYWKMRSGYLNTPYGNTLLARATNAQYSRVVKQGSAAPIARPYAYGGPGRIRIVAKPSWILDASIGLLVQYNASTRVTSMPSFRAFEGITAPVALQLQVSRPAADYVFDSDEEIIELMEFAESQGFRTTARREQYPTGECLVRKRLTNLRPRVYSGVGNSFDPGSEPALDESSQGPYYVARSATFASPFNAAAKVDSTQCRFLFFDGSLLRNGWKMMAVQFGPSTEANLGNKGYLALPGVVRRNSDRPGFSLVLQNTGRSDFCAPSSACAYSARPAFSAIKMQRITLRGPQGSDWRDAFRR